MPSPTQKHCKLYIKDASGEIIQMLPRTTIPEYQGATGSASGTAGTVPPASSAEKDNFLKGDGTWGEIEKADAAGEFETAQTVALTGDVTGSATSKAGWSIAATLASTGVSASTYGPSASASPSHGGKFSVPSFTVDAKGRITSAATREITLPASGNTDTKVNVTLDTTTKAYLLGTTATPTSTAAAVAAVADTGVYLDTAAGKLTATTFAGSLSGNASSATEFSAAKAVTLTGDVTGTASSKAGWSVATTLADSGVTAGTIGNDTQQTPSHGGTFNIPYVTVDSKGRVTAGGTTTVKLPADNNTDTKVNVTLGTTTKAYLLGTSTTPTSTAAGVTAVADTGVYLDTTAGRLTAGSFAGNVENGTLATANAVVVTDANKKLTASTSITATELGYLDGVTSSIQTQLNAKAEDSGVVHTTGAETVAGVKTFTSDLEVQKLHYLGDRSFSIGTQGTGAGTYLQINSLVDSKSITIANQGTNNITLTSKGNITATGTITGNKIVGDGSGLTSLNGSSIATGTVAADRIANLDASKITSGTIDIARLPAGALERLVTVADQTARFALTASDVQLGDTVKQEDTGLMYYVVDTSKLSSADGYAEYTAGSATSVPWTGVTGKPSTFAPSAHNQASSTINAMTGYSKPSSTSAIGTSDTLNAAIGKLEKALDGKAASSHNQASSTINAMTGYSKPSSTSAISTSDTLNAAIGKLEKALDGKQASGSYAASTHSHTGTEVVLTGYSKASSAEAVAATDTANAAIGKLEKALDGKAASSHGTHVTFSTDAPKAAGTASAGGSSTVTVAKSDHVHPLQTTVSGNAGTATKFASAQTVALTGDVTGSASSQAGWSIAATLADSGVTAGTIGNDAQQTPAHGGTFNIPYVTVDSKGRVTAGGTTTVKLPADNNTDTKVNVTLGTTTKAYLLGTSTTPTSTAAGVTAISDTGVYLDTTAGRLTAGSFAGDGQNITYGSANAVVVTDANKKLVSHSSVTTTELGYLDGVTSSIQTQLNGKAASNHNQASSTINAMTGYSKPSSTSAIGTSDTLNAAIGKLEKALDGKQASGSYAASSHNHDASNINSGTLDAARIPNLDASKITSGTIDIARLPAGALERLVTVADQTARFALTSSDVQLGDTVRQEDTGLMYYVVDTSKLSSADGYAEYTAGAATSVPWSGVTGKPSTYAPSSHNQASSTINAMTGYSKPSSTSAIAATDTLNAAIGKLEKALDGKQASGSYAAASHNQASSTINAMTGYSKPSSTSAIGTSDTLNAAIGKLEKALDGKQASGSYAAASHNHASSEVTAMTSYAKPSSTSAIAATDTLNAAIGKLEKALDGKAASSHGTHVTYSTSNPLVAGTASAGSANNVSRGDHVHPEQTTVKQAKGVFLVIPTQTSQTATLTATVDGITEYFPGLTIAYRAPFNTAASSTLNINSLGAKPIYYKVNTTSKDYYPANTVILLVYETTTTSGGCWKMVFSYDGNNNNYDRRLHNNNVMMAAAVAANTIIVGTSAGYKQAASGITFDLAYPILVATEAKAAAAVSAKTYEALPTVNLQTTKASWTGTQYAMAFLVGTLSGNTVTIDSSVFTTTVPSTADGKIYIPIGLMASTYQIFFASSKDVYQYTNGSFHLLDTTTAATGGTNGTVKINGTEIAVKGLGSAAYTASTAYAASSHNQASSTINAMTGYSKPSSTSAIGTSDTLNAAIGKLEKALDGKQASGSYAAASHNHDASNINSGTLDAARIPNLDASKITSGTIDIARLPAGALERLVTVADQTARFALTSSNVQLGDTVRQSDTGLMYYVVDTSKLNSADGYAEYTAGAATSVPWSGITSKPSTYAPSAHNQASNTINAMTGYSKPSSTSAIGTSDTLNAAIGKLEKALDGKQASGSYAAASHNQASSTINAMTGYSKPSSTSAIGTSDTLNAAIGKLEKALDGKQASGTYLTPSSTLDATKLSGTIPSGCYTDTVYTHPTTSGNKHVPSGGSSGQFLGWSADGTAKWVANPNSNWTTHLYAGAASNATANATSATTNAATYIVVCDNSTARNAVQVTGTNGTTVSAVNGKLTIDSVSLSAVTNAEIDAAIFA